jgi:predicted secreted Zn-dependent protease
MYLHRLAALVSFLVMGLCAAPAAQATLHYEERSETIDIGSAGADSGSISQAMRRFGADANGAHTNGAANARLTWTRSVQRGTSGCKVKTIDVNLNVSLAVPAWQGRSRAAPELQKLWDCGARTVTAHEKRHAKLWQDAGHKLDRELTAIADWMPCNQLDDLLKESAERIQAEARSQHAAFEADERRRSRMQQCKVEPKVPVVSADAKDGPGPDGGQSESGSKSSMDAADQSSDTSGGAAAREVVLSTAAPRLGSRIKTASGSLAYAASSSVWVLLWIGGLLVAGTAGFVIFMKHRLTQRSEVDVEVYKERSALLRLARKVDASTGKHIARSSLPDRTGLRRRQLRPG